MNELTAQEAQQIIHRQAGQIGSLHLSNTTLAVQLEGAHAEAANLRKRIAELEKPVDEDADPQPESKPA